MCLQGSDSSFVTEQRRNCIALSGYLCHPVQVLLWGARMNTRLVVRVSEPRLLHDVEEEVRKVVDGIIPIAVYASHYRRLHYQVATVVLAHLL